MSWLLEPNSAIQIGELSKGAEIGGLMAKTGGLEADYGSSAIQIAEIRQLELTNVPNFPLAEFLSIGFTHHIMQDFRQPMGVATYKTADEIDPDLLKALPPKEELERLLEPEGFFGAFRDPTVRRRGGAATSSKVQGPSVQLLRVSGEGRTADQHEAASAAVCAAVFGVVKSRVRFRRVGWARKKSGARRASWLNWLINMVYFLGQD